MRCIQITGEGIMRIAFFEVNDWEEKYLENRLKGHFLKFSKETLDSERAEQIKDFDAVSVFVYSKVDEQTIKKIPKLKLIATRSTGFDHIDLEACKKQGITVCNVPSYGENTVAEHTFALILSLSRSICKSCLKRFEHDFSIEELMGFDLKGKTIGVVGTGQIGLHVIRIAKGFGMNVVAYDVRQNRLLSEVLGFEYTSLEDLLARSDIITLHVPHIKATHHLINKDTFKLVKKGAILINTSRGAIVDNEALIEALDNKTLAGAGLDVVEGEELVKEEKQLLHEPKSLEVLTSFVRNHVLLDKDNVIFTPHIAFYSQEALERMLETTVQNIAAYVSGNPQNVV
ncbi:MAG: hydroxyacid dehydrogenase [Candidatus Bathyarchaeota archaeon]|nr:hydroxyacid dehydrogenase [Candidatus Bathyarchaeota archaeon]